MLSVVIDPAAFGGADFFRADLARLIEWVEASPPIEPGGSVLLPGEIERRVREERERNGIPLDARELVADRRRRRLGRRDAARGPRRMTSAIRPHPLRQTPRLGRGPPMASSPPSSSRRAFASIAANAGAEFVLFDMEHGGVGIDTLKAQIAFARGTGIAPLVRVPGLAYHLIAPVLDAGAMGIMVPMIETAEQAEKLASWCRYRPEGVRGLGFGVGHDDYTRGDVVAKMRRRRTSARWSSP